MAVVRGSGTAAKATVKSRVQNAVKSAQRTIRLANTPVAKVAKAPKPKAAPKKTMTGLNVAKALKASTAAKNKTLKGLY